MKLNSMKVYRQYAREMLPETADSKADQKAWEHIVEQADDLPMEERPPDTRYNATVDRFETKWLKENGSKVALLPREQELTGLLDGMTNSAENLSSTQVEFDKSSLPLPQWTRPFVRPLEDFKKGHFKLAKRLAQTSPFGKGAKSEEVYLADVLRLQEVLGESDRSALLKMQGEYFPWDVPDQSRDLSTEIYAKPSAGIRVELGTSQSLRFSGIQKLSGQAHGKRKVFHYGLTFHVPKGSKVLLQGSAEFKKYGTLNLTDVKSAGNSGQATFDSWFRHQGKVYKSSRKLSRNSAEGQLQSSFGFIVTAPAEAGKSVPRVLDSGVLELPPIYREEAFFSFASSKGAGTSPPD